MERYAHVVGWGKSVPEKVMTNDDLAKMVDTNDGWIRERTGIGERRVAGSRDSTLTLAARAASDAIEVADVNPDEIDLVVVATATPEYPFPATACLVQDAVGATRAGAFDLEAGCSGFVYGLAVGSAMIRSGQINTALIVGAETLTRIVDWKDRSTCVLFGDGAGAFMLRGSQSRGGILSTVLGSDGSGGDLLQVPGGGSRHPSSPETVTSNMHVIKMNGHQVYRFATRVMAQAARQAIEKAKLPVEEVDLLIPHQANLRIIDSAAKALKLPPEKVFVNLERYGNTSAASIPIALCEAVEAGRINPGDHLVFVGFGAGLTWASCALEWTDETTRREMTLQRQAEGRVRFVRGRLNSFGLRALRRIDASISRVIDRLEQNKKDA